MLILHDVSAPPGSCSGRLMRLCALPSRGSSEELPMQVYYSPGLLRAYVFGWKLLPRFTTRSTIPPCPPQCYRATGQVALRYVLLVTQLTLLWLDAPSPATPQCQHTSPPHIARTRPVSHSSASSDATFVSSPPGPRPSTHILTPSTHLQPPSTRPPFPASLFSQDLALYVWNRLPVCLLPPPQSPTSRPSVTTSSSGVMPISTPPLPSLHTAILCHPPLVFPTPTQSPSICTVHTSKLY